MLRGTQSRNLGGVRRLGVLDGLRGVAVLLVLWYHIWEISWLPAPLDVLQFVPATGFVGVELFFFLSGFVIVYPFITAHAEQRPAPSWSHFAWRRFIKIVPSYLLSIGVAYALGYAQAQPNASPVPDLVTHLLFIHTWFTDRFGSINGVLWTLAVEVEFYALFPLVWWCFKRRPWWTFGAMIAISIAWRSALQTCCYTTLFPNWEDNVPGFLDVFGSGMIAAYLFVRFGSGLSRRPVILMPLLSIAGVAALVALLESLYAARMQDQWSAVWEVRNRTLLGFAFIVIALGFLTSARAWQTILDNPPLRFLATISYNLYLYHQLIARQMLTWHFAPHGQTPDDDPVWQARYTPIAFAVTIAQAAIVTYCFERPLLRIKDPPRLMRRRAGNPG
jgi:peptidoglycan/LPS O-acetylase OafA/YrhL